MEASCMDMMELLRPKVSDIPIKQLTSSASEGRSSGRKSASTMLLPLSLPMVSASSYYYLLLILVALLCFMHWVPVIHLSLRSISVIQCVSCFALLPDSFRCPVEVSASCCLFLHRWWGW